MFRTVFKTSLPVAFGYIPLGMAFGVLLAASGYSWWLAPLMGLVIFAGSAQFLAVGMLASGSGPAEAFVATLVLNLRHVFYGLALLDRYRALGARRIYAIFGLTDETFSVLTSLGSHPENDGDFVLGVTALNQFWWVLGCAVGSFLGAMKSFPTAGLEFSLTALFVVLFLEQIRKVFHVGALVFAAGAAFLALFFLPSKFFLLGAVGLSCLFLVTQKGEFK